MIYVSFITDKVDRKTDMTRYRQSSRIISRYIDPSLGLL